MNKWITLILMMALGVHGCAPKVTSKKSDVDISENLSQYRPQYEINENMMVKEDLKKEKSYPEPTHDITRDVNGLLEDLAAYNSNVRTIDGYTIIIPGSDRQDATRMRQQVYSQWPELKPQLKYESPNFKVVVGQFYSKIEAQQVFSRIKKEFPKALLVPEKVTKPQ